MNCEDKPYSMISLEYISNGHLRKDDDGYGMDVDGDKFLERNNTDASFSQTKGGGFNKLFPPSFYRMNSEEIGDFVNSLECLFDRHLSEDSASYGRHVAMDAPLDRIKPDDLFSMTNGEKCIYLFPGSFSGMSYQDIAGSVNSRECLLLDGHSSEDDAPYRMDVAINNVLDRNMKDPLFSKIKGEEFKELFTPSSSQMKYGEIPEGKKSDCMNNADLFFSEYEGKPKNDLLSPYDDNNDGMVECQEPLDVNEQPKMSDEFVEWVNQLDLDESPERNGRQYVASCVETKTTVSHTREEEHSSDECESRKISYTAISHFRLLLANHSSNLPPQGLQYGKRGQFRKECDELSQYRHPLYFLVVRRQHRV